MKTIKIFASLHCSSCEIKIESKLKNLIEEIQTNVALGLIKVTFDENKTNEEEIKKIIKDLGYEITE